MLRVLSEVDAMEQRENEEIFRSIELVFFAPTDALRCK